MHWSEILAQQVIERNPHKEEYVCATGISPSGSIHIGNFRDIATSYFVVLALRKLGRKARLIHSWDNFDRLRKIPANVAAVASDMERYIGCALADVPNPFAGENDAPTYAAHFEREFADSLEKFGIAPDYRYQVDLYRAGKYTKEILLALSERGRIFDILDSFRTQDAIEGERDSYYPVAIYCSECGHDTTKIQDYDETTHIAHYQCKCGHQSEFDFNADFNCKLSWKIDWAMRWGYEGVDFEPGGQDHASPSGSYQTSRIIAKEIFGVDAPIFQGYSFIGLKGATGKMSGSSGLNLTPKTLLKIYEPEVILWLYSRTDPSHSFDFCFDEGILRQYTEFDRMYNAVANDTATDVEQAIMFNCAVNHRVINTVPMSWLVQFGSVVNFSPSVLETVFTKIGTPYKTSEFAWRLELAQNWLEMCSPESVNHLNKHRNWAAYEVLSEDEQREIAVLHENLLNNEYTLDELNAMIYAVPMQVFGAIDDPKRKKTLQAAFFKNVYRLLIGKEQGPRLYLFLYALERGAYMHLLDFDAPKTEEEIAAEHPSVVEVIAEIESESADDNAVTVQPIKPPIQIDDFAKLDLRVCEIIKCQEIRKSHNCYKLTLNDGSSERVIVSSIKHDYTPEQLTGKKIIVLVNLAPARITGVTSEGMLLATSNDHGKNTVIFVDEIVPNGSSLH
ncbi:MAG: lysine--tRNA ligase [Clostridiales bacterium]|jgi:lysyl-tRNA synthetase class 1|nr:lysine--tRNA ligase [Clostridiales bacterium]